MAPDDSNYIEFPPQDAHIYPYNLLCAIFPIKNKTQIPADFHIALNYALHHMGKKKPREMEILMLHYQKGLSFPAISMQKNMPRNYVAQVCNLLCSQLCRHPYSERRHHGINGWIQDWKKAAAAENYISKNTFDVQEYLCTLPQCLVIGNENLIAQDFIDHFPIISHHHSRVLYREHLTHDDPEVDAFLKNQSATKTVYICKALSHEEAQALIAFLIQIPLHADHDRPLADYIPTKDKYVAGTAMRLTDKGSHWVLRTIDMSNNKAIF